MNLSLEEKRAALRERLLKQSVCIGEFTLASGKKSDFYVDSKLTTLDPRGLSLVGELGWDLVERAERDLGIEIAGVGGLTLGADPIAVAIALRSIQTRPEGVQSFVVRKEPKKHGRNRLIEGNFEPGMRVAVIDDVITTGGSTLQAIQAVEESGGTVAFVIVLVDRQEGGRRAIEARGCPVYAIFERSELISASSASPAASR